MMNRSYRTAIEVPQPAHEVFARIADVSNWWSKDYEGGSSRLGDEFIINHPGAHYSKQRLVEVIPNRRVVWLVTESELPWLRDPSEWTGTRMVFEISSREGMTTLDFTHEGLVPEKECYSRCQQGWNMVIGDWLFRLITTGRTIHGLRDYV